jgi:hypothetical protein
VTNGWRSSQRLLQMNGWPQQGPDASLAEVMIWL